MPKPSGASPSDRQALVLAPEAPYPVIGGGPMRTACLLEYLRRRYAVTVITFREPGAPRPEFPEGVQAHVIDLPVHGKSTPARALRNLRRAIAGAPPLVDRFGGFERQVEAIVAGRRFETAVIEHFWCAPYAGVLGPICDKLVLDLHNIESELLHRSARVERGPAALLLKRFAARCTALEQEWLPRFSTVLAPSDVPCVNAVFYPNTIPYVPQPSAPRRHEIAFSGNLEYHPNRAAVRWFKRNIWPLLRAEEPNLRWRLIGKNDHAIRTTIAGDDRIEATGAIPDAIYELARASVAVVPLLSGSGTRIKIIESWAAGVPVVSTSIGAEGLPYTHGHDLLIADQPADFTAAVRQVLHDSDLARRLSEGGRRLYEDRLTWSTAWECLKQSGL